LRVKRTAELRARTSEFGTSRHCAAAQQFSRFRSEADMGKPFAEPNL